jgi:hypothetical protein
MKNKWLWRPLQHILQADLEMITEEKVTVGRSLKSEFESPLVSFPWGIHQHTQRDVHLAVVAFSRLPDAIESRLPPKSTHILPGSSEGIELLLRSEEGEDHEAMNVMILAEQGLRTEERRRERGLAN